MGEGFVLSLCGAQDLWGLLIPAADRLQTEEPQCPPRTTALEGAKGAKFACLVCWVGPALLWPQSGPPWGPWWGVQSLAGWPAQAEQDSGSGWQWQ